MDTVGVQGQLVVSSSSLFSKHVWNHCTTRSAVCVPACFNAAKENEKKHKFNSRRLINSNCSCSQKLFLQTVFIDVLSCRCTRSRKELVSCRSKCEHTTQTREYRFEIGNFDNVSCAPGIWLKLTESDNGKLTKSIFCKRQMYSAHLYSTDEYICKRIQIRITNTHLTCQI